MNRMARDFFVKGMTLVVMLMFVLLGMVRAQDHPTAFFPYPATFEINGVVNYGDLLGVQAAIAGDFTGDGNLDIVSIAGGVWEVDVAPGNGDGTFLVPVANIYSTVPYGTSPYALAAGDFNGDGRLDLAVWCTYAPMNYNEVVILLGNGNGTFTLGNTFPSTNAYGNPLSNSLAVGDFTGGGKLDLAALAPYCGGSNYYPCVSIFAGNGDGTFQTPVTYSTVDPNHPFNGYNAYGLAVGDLNGDGKPDIAVNQSTGIVVLLNNGSGAFGGATFYDAGLNRTAEPGIAIGDVTGDKLNDVVVGSQGAGDVELFVNQGNGTFVSKGSVGKTLGGSCSYLVDLADINGDKKLDMLVSDCVGQIWTFYGKGNGTFTAGPVYPTQYWEQITDNLILADFNNDNVLDIFKQVGGQTWDGEVILGRSDGTFQMNPAYGSGVTGFGKNLVNADFNGDGYPDVAFSWAHSNNLPAFSVMLGNSHGALAAPTYNTYLTPTCAASYPEWLAAGDVNGDGKADVVATLQNSTTSGCPLNQVAIFPGLGNGKFSAPVLYATGSTAQSYDIFLADVNGDGKLDMIVSNYDGTISVLLNIGKGRFGTAILISSVAAMSAHLHSLTLGDFNGDGKLDIAAATYYPGDQTSLGSDVFVLLGNGDGTFHTPISTAAAPTYVYATTLAAGDFNKDGKLDLLVTLEGSTGPTCSGWHGAAAYTILTGNGDGTFTVPNSFNCIAGDFPMYPVVADFNADGKLDALIPMLEGTGKDPYGPVLLQGKGDGTFTRMGESEYQWVNGTEIEQFKGGYYVGATSYGAVAGDFNADGALDVAVLNADTYAIGDYVSFVTVMFNNTQPVSLSPLSLNFGSVAVGSSKSLTVILTNNQTKTLTISSINVTGTNASEFTQSSNCGTSRKPGFECTITVKFTPMVLGVQSATLSINDSLGTQTVALASTNPRPTATTLTPSSATHGGPAFTLTVGGTNFINGSVVNWNGSPRTTTYVSSVEVTAQITAADIKKAGTDKVTVTNAAPGGGTSAALTFTVN